MKKSILFFLISLFLIDAVQAQNAGDLQLIQYYENAIKKSPNNSELYDTLGLLYNEFSEEQLKAGNKKGALENNKKAEKCFLNAVQKNAKDFTANFSLGVIYLNDAIAFTKMMNEQEPDFTTEGKATYNLQKKENTDLFKKTLTFFKKAETINPNHFQTLIALKTIFGQLDDEENLAVFIKRVKHLQNGELHASSYFK